MILNIYSFILIFKCGEIIMNETGESNKILISISCDSEFSEISIILRFIHSYIASLPILLTHGGMTMLLIDDSATVKTFYKEEGIYRLQPENDTMEPIIVREVEILGKVIGVFRFMR